MSEFISTCPKCRQKILCDTQYVGQRVACPLCMQEIVMPSPSNVSSAPSAPAQSQPAAQGGKSGVPMIAVVVGTVAIVAAAGAVVWVAANKHSTASTPAPTPTQAVSSTPAPVVATPSPIAPQSAVKGVKIPNSGFEFPPTDNYQYDPSGAGVYWTFSTNGPSSGSGVATFSTANSSFTAKNPTAPEGTQVAFLQATGSISQALSGFTLGAKYKLSFAAAQRANKHGGQMGETFSVLINSNVIANFSPDQSTSIYYEYSANFTAPSATATLTFLGTDLNGGDNTVLLDDVQIVNVP